MQNVLEKNEKGSKILQVIILTLVSVYIFFEYLIPVSYIYPLIIAFIVIYYINKKYLLLTKKQLLPIILILVYAIYQLILARFTIYPEISIYDATFRVAIMFIGVLFYLDGSWYEKGTKIFLIFSGIHVLFTLISYLLPNFFFTVILQNLPQHIQNEIIYFLLDGVYSGITEQVGRNAFYITVGLAIIYSKLSSSRKLNIKTLLPFGIYMLALLLTGKRGHLIANLATMIFIYLYKAKSKNKIVFVQLIKVILGISIAIIVLILIFPEASAPIDLFAQRIEEGNITTGRINLYRYAVEEFKQKPIMGWGTGIFKTLHITHVHNVYLQLLVENGVAGFVLFVTLMMINFIKTIKKLQTAFLIKKNNIIFHLFFSLYIQLFFMIYGMTGNPLSDSFILFIYLIASSIPFSLRIYNFTNDVCNKKLKSTGQRETKLGANNE